MSDYGASEMSGPLPRVSGAPLSEGPGGDATGSDITQAAAAQWASFGSLDDNTSDAALETNQGAAAAVDTAVPVATQEAEVLTPDDAQPSSAEARSPAELVAEGAVNPASPAVGGLSHQLSGSPGDSRWATNHCTLLSQSTDLLASALSHPVLQCAKERIHHLALR